MKSSMLSGASSIVISSCHDVSSVVAFRLTVIENERGLAVEHDAHVVFHVPEVRPAWGARQVEPELDWPQRHVICHERHRPDCTEVHSNTRVDGIRFRRKVALRDGGE